MSTKNPKVSKVPKKVVVDPAKGTPMDKFHQAMKKIVSVPKKDLKSK